MERRVLFLQTESVTCYRVERGSVAVERQWQIDHDRLPDDLCTCLNHNRHTEFNLLIDLAEEECHLESFKTVGRRDQKHLIAKMKNKRFENALLSKAGVMGSGRSVSLLLSGVAKHKICADLISQFEQSGVCIRAIHSPLTLTSALTKLSHTSKGPCLFVIPLNGCYRLLACVGSFVIFNRRIVTPQNLANGKLSSDRVAKNEMLRASLTETLIYLQRQQIEGWNTPCLIVPGSSLVTDCLKDVFKSMADSGLVSEIRDLQPVSEQRLKSVSLTAEEILVAAACHCGNGYATKTHRSSYTTRKVRNVCAALALCSAGGAVSTVAVARKLTDQYEALSATYRQSALALKNTVSENNPLHEYSVEAVRQAMVTVKLIELESSQSPVKFLHELAENVQLVPGVSVSSVQWEIEDVLNDESLTEMLTHSAAKKTLDVQQVYRATVSGAVLGSPDTALTNFESFVTALRGANADPSVVVVDTPFGLGSQDKTTTSSLSDATGEFVLELSAERTVR